MCNCKHDTTIYACVGIIYTIYKQNEPKRHTHRQEAQPPLEPLHSPGREEGEASQPEEYMVLLESIQVLTALV